MRNVFQRGPWNIDKYLVILAHLFPPPVDWGNIFNIVEFWV